MREENLNERSAGSFLVRVWWEEREIEGEDPILRGYVRNLRSGKQEYFGQTDKLGDLVVRQLEGTAAAVALADDDTEAVAKA